MNKTNEELSQLFSGIKNTFFWSLKYVDDKEIIYYSENIFEITGYTGEEIKSFQGGGNALIIEEDIQKFKKSFIDFTNDPSMSFLKLDYRITRKDKKVVWLEESVTVERNKEGKSQKYFGLVADITEFKEKEVSLNGLLENYKQLNSSKDRFISILSHDLRAPFTSILGFSEILINEPNLSYDERLEYLNYINESSQNQLQLVNYLLDWSRLQTGGIRIEPQRLHAQTLVFNCISSLTGNAIRKNLDIKVFIKDSLYIQADERMLTQVITNIISNAIKFSTEGKTIEVSADTFNESFVEFIVKDEGIGISDSNKIKLFKIEKMFSTEGTKGEKGTGLGLSLVKEIIDKHNGSIWFYTELDKGSEFHFTIPSSPNTILLVENNSIEKDLYETVLKNNFPSFHVIGVKNGYEALNHLISQLPSLIITDYELPLMNGTQFIKSVRKEDKGGKIPIIALVPELSEDVRRQYQMLGIDIVLQKPVDNELFSEKIQLLLEYQ
ncbi:MAG: ATP-binding protein [Ignavibacteriaceae bacterium]